MTILRFSMVLVAGALALSACGGWFADRTINYGPYYIEMVRAATYREFSVDGTERVDSRSIYEGCDAAGSRFDYGEYLRFAEPVAPEVVAADLEAAAFAEGWVESPVEIWGKAQPEGPDDAPVTSLRWPVDDPEIAAVMNLYVSPDGKAASLRLDVVSLHEPPIRCQS